MIKIIKFFRANLTSELLSGAVLVGIAILAIIIANSKLLNDYNELLNLNLLEIFPYWKESLSNSISLHWFVNEVLISFFFLLIGLELKKEITCGELSSRKKLILPIICAFGGVIAPMIIFVIFNYNNSQNLHGFAIACATDIAFTYGIISIFGKVFTKSLRVFIIALAIIDDVIAILIIAIFYTEKINFWFLTASSICCIFMMLISASKFKIVNQILNKKITYYWIFGAILWTLLFKSGINPTLSGTILGLIVPVNNNQQNARMINSIFAMVNFLILPIFAFANFGINLSNISIEYLAKPVIIGTAFGLFFGKQFGVLSLAWIAIRLKLSHLPRGTSWQEFYCASIFTGIGFTMSIFIATIAFREQVELFLDAKLGILLGSIMSILWGGILTRYIILKASK